MIRSRLITDSEPTKNTPVSDADLFVSRAIVINMDELGGVWAMMI